ncbi:IlvD/Edd family dehydratase [Limobrevibacterium gyesilva]|uniref:Dihydroxy-acid dehydratase n=1 Tax=Limobrevibacterium gyesilva TaxID=2991712 RepID=A0AA41YLS9_9PROT|nr:dihydroxy-acid dehydratase [Limobrevibacterium gyesilva]
MATGLRKGLTSYGDAGFSLFLRRAFIKAMGFSDDALDRPIVGITNTYSDFNPCHGNVPDLIEAVKRGVMLAGGLPMAFPTVSIHESFSHPTSMFLRNLMALDTEEMIRAQPMDAVVLIGGCDKTIPAQLMGAASADIPAIVLPTGPMLVGHYKGEVLGACTDCRRLWAKHRAGELDEAEIDAVNGRLAPTKGTCMVMGTASTVACMTEALGMTLPGAGSIPATHADRIRAAEASGAAAVRLAASGTTPRQIMTPAAFRNAFTVLQAIGGSTNAVIHFTAIAGRLGIEIDLEEFDRLGLEVPVLVDLKPTGEHYMEHFHWAGGVPRLLQELAPMLDTAAATVGGVTLADVIAAAEQVPGQTVIRPFAKPIATGGGLAVLRGNLAPGGALLKRSAATARLMQHEGRAVVFDGLEDMAARLDDDALDVTPDDVLVLRNAGPKGAPGMPEAGYIPIPRKLARQGVKDMVRISDARMSGTAFGTIVLHITPEATVGGALALVRNGDRIRLDAAARRIDLLVDAAELARRRAAWQPPAPPPGAERGYLRLFLEQVTQADQGCDFAFCRPPAPAPADMREPAYPADQ